MVSNDSGEEQGGGGKRPTLPTPAEPPEIGPNATPFTYIAFSWSCSCGLYADAESGQNLGTAMCGQHFSQSKRARDIPKWMRDNLGPPTKMRRDVYYKPQIAEPEPESDISANSRKWLGL